MRTYMISTDMIVGTGLIIALLLSIGMGGVAGNCRLASRAV